MAVLSSSLPARTGDDTDGEHPGRPETALFRCPTCDDVYVAVEKTTCSNCGGDVEQVRSTLSRTTDARADD